MIKVLHVAKMIGASGMENHLLLLLPGLRARGINAILMILVEADKPMTEYVASMNARGVPTHTMIIQRDLDLGLVTRLAAFMRHEHIEAVHTHLIHADVHGWWAARLAGVRRLYTSAHNDDGFRKLWPVRLFQALLWRQVTAGVAISEALRQFLIRVEFAPPHKLHTVHYGFDPAEMPAATQDKASVRRTLKVPLTLPLFGSVCRLVPQKGLIYALQAFARVAARFDAHYVIVGDGPLRGALTAEAAHLGIADRVHFLGWRADARTLYPAFDIFLMPSLWEGFGLVALEAMAASLPILASRVSALPEIVVAGATGYLAAPTAVAELTAHMTTLLSDPARAAAMGQAGSERLMTAFSVERMVTGMLRVYQQA